MTRFSEILRSLRKSKDLSQEQLAEQFNVSRRTVSSWETAFREPDFATLVNIATFFEVSTDYLLGLEE